MFATFFAKAEGIELVSFTKLSDRHYQVVFRVDDCRVAITIPADGDALTNTSNSLHKVADEMALEAMEVA